MRIEIIGTPFNGLRDHTSIENPSVGLRQVGIVEALKKGGLDVVDLGDLEGFQCQDIRDPKTGINDFDLWLGLSRDLSQTISAIVGRKSWPLILGGDCRMLVGILGGMVQHFANIGLVFLDGHADYHTAKTSISGDPADMELAVLTGRGPRKITHMAGRYPIIKESDVVVYGIRAWDRIDESNIKVYDRNLLGNMGVRRGVEEGLKSFVERNLPAWLHLDVDVLDPDVMPVMFSEPGGLNFGEAHELLDLVLRSSQIVGLSIACYHPRLDQDGRARTPAR